MSDTERTVWLGVFFTTQNTFHQCRRPTRAVRLTFFDEKTPWTIAIWDLDSLPPEVPEIFDQLDQQQRDDWAAWPGSRDNWASWSTKNRPDLVLTRKPNTATSKAKFLVGFKNFSFINPCFFISLPWQPRQQQSMLDMSFLREFYELRKLIFTIALPRWLPHNNSLEFLYPGPKTWH